MRHNKSLERDFCWAAPTPQKPLNSGIRHHKVQHRDQQQRFRHTAPHVEHDLAMLYEWLNRSHIVEWWGGEEARPTLADVQEQYLPSVFSAKSVTPYIAMLNGEPIGYTQSYVTLGSEGMDGKKKPIQEYAE